MYRQHHNGHEIRDHLHQLERQSEALQGDCQRFRCSQHKTCDQRSPSCSLSHHFGCNRDEATTSGHVLAEPCDIAEREIGTCRTAKDARKYERLHLNASGVNACCACGFGINTRCAQMKAEPRPHHQKADGRNSQQCDKAQDMDIADIRNAEAWQRAAFQRARHALVAGGNKKPQRGACCRGNIERDAGHDEIGAELVDR